MATQIWDMPPKTITIKEAAIIVGMSVICGFIIHMWNQSTELPKGHRKLEVIYMGRYITVQDNEQRTWLIPTENVPKDLLAKIDPGDKVEVQMDQWDRPDHMAIIKILSKGSLPVPKTRWIPIHSGSGLVLSGTEI